MIVWNIGTTTKSPMHAGKYIGTFDFHYKFEIVALTMGHLKKLKLGFTRIIVISSSRVIFIRFGAFRFFS